MAIGFPTAGNEAGHQNEPVPVDPISQREERTGLADSWQTENQLQKRLRRELDEATDAAERERIETELAALKERLQTILGNLDAA